MCWTLTHSILFSSFPPTLFLSLSLFIMLRYQLPSCICLCGCPGCQCFVRWLTPFCSLCTIVGLAATYQLCDHVDKSWNAWTKWALIGSAMLWGLVMILQVRSHVQCHEHAALSCRNRLSRVTKWQEPQELVSAKLCLLSRSPHRVMTHSALDRRMAHARLACFVIPRDFHSPL